MSDLSFREYYETVKGKNLNDFVQEIKESPIYDTYKQVVKGDKRNDTARFLQVSSLMLAIKDERFAALMESVSTDLLFAMADQRLRSEILNEGEGRKNAD